MSLFVLPNVSLSVLNTVIHISKGQSKEPVLLVSPVCVYRLFCLPEEVRLPVSLARRCHLGLHK